MNSHAEALRLTDSTLHVLSKYQLLLERAEPSA